MVGESGSGKTLTALAVLGLLPRGVIRSAGAIHIAGHVADATSDMRSMRGSLVGMIFQEPATALNPVMRIDHQLLEARQPHHKLTGGAARDWCHATLQRVGLDDPKTVARAYPHELSGGMRQRVLIAMGIAAEPALVLADEPTTALDAVHRGAMLDVLREEAKRGAGVLLITHDLASVRGWADQVEVMYAGSIRESGPADQVLSTPSDPYTKALLACVPGLKGQGPLPEMPVDTGH